MWIHHQFRGVPLGLLVVGLVAGSMAGHPRQALQKPVRRTSGPLVALASLPSGSLILLESRGGVYRLNPGASHLEPLAQAPGLFDASDLAAGRFGNQEMIFVCLYSRISPNAQMSGPPIRGKLVQYSAQGEEIRAWDLPTQGLFSIAVDPPEQMVYLGNARTSEIFTINLRDPRSPTPRYLLELYGTSSIGALALDTEHKRLFVADVVAGKLFVVDLEHRKTRVLATSLGEPSALAFDASEQKLYIADAGRRRVWVLRPSASSQKPTVFSAPPEFSEPRGLILDANRTVWVADYRARAIFALSPSGKVVRTIRQ